jgi:hypothetical protein
VVCLLTAVFCLVPQTARAHGGATSAPQAVTYDVGGLQIRAVLGAVSRVPGTMLIDLSLTAPASREVPVAVRAWASVESTRPADPMSTVRLLPGDAGPYPTQVRVDRAGPWDIELELAKDVGAVSTARIPVTVTLPLEDPAETSRSIFYAAAGLIAVTGPAVAVLARRRSRRVPAVAMAVTVPATVCALAVAVTLSVVRLPPVDPAADDGGSGAAAALAANPAHVNVGLAAVAGQPRVGRPTVLEFVLTDGSTGQPVDDVKPHHEALLHVAVIGTSAQDFAHVHPARVAPGRYRLAWTPTGPGPHDVEIELTRGLPGQSTDLGNQVIERTIQVAGRTTAGRSSGPAPAPVGGLGKRRVAGLAVDVRATGPLVAGEPVGFEATVTDAGRPVGLAPWLGMTGHLMIRNPRTELFAHVHAIGPMAPVPALAGVRTDGMDPMEQQLFSVRGRDAVPDEPMTAQDDGPAAGDSVIRFAYTFPAAGRYDAWMQFRPGDRVVTVPLRLEVTR